MEYILITGASRGLGRGLLEESLNRKARVIVLGQNAPENVEMGSSPGTCCFIRCNLKERDSIQQALNEAIEGIPKLDIVFLNAGVLGKLSSMLNLSLPEVQEVLDVNLWANKIILDALVHPEQTVKVDHIVGISSGAAIKGSGGWGPYSISKAALNIMFQVYADEHPDVHFTALAPGIIRTSMTESIVEEAPEDPHHPASKRIREVFKKDAPLTPSAAAKRIFKHLPSIRKKPSGEYVDVRDF